MAKESSPSESPFDLEKLRALVELMEKHDLSVITLRSGTEKWHLRRGAPEVVMPNMAAPATLHAVPSGVTHSVPSETASSTSGPSASGSDSVSDGLVEIKSPTVGTFYAAPSPDDPPYVKVGSKVEPDTLVCLVEAMKVFNQIPAEVNGTIVEILVKDGDAVEFGQPMFKVRPS